MAALVKPSRLERQVGKWERQTVREKEKQARKRQADRKWSALSALVCQRDKGRCRVCGVETIRAGHGDPRLFGAAHHITFRSLGGKDTMSNLVWVCAICHEEAHGPALTIAGTADALEVTYG